MSKNKTTFDEEASSSKEGTVPHRFYRLVTELQKRFPSPNPFDSSKAPEDHALDAIDLLLDDTVKQRAQKVIQSIRSHLSRSNVEIPTDIDQELVNVFHAPAVNKLAK